MREAVEQCRGVKRKDRRYRWREEGSEAQNGMEETEGECVKGMRDAVFYLVT